MTRHYSQYILGIQSVMEMNQYRPCLQSTGFPTRDPRLSFLLVMSYVSWSVDA